MHIERYVQNPLVSPKDIKPWHNGSEVIGAFNAGIAEHNGEILMLLRVAERPISPDPAIVCVPRIGFEGGHPELVIEKYRRDDPVVDFSDPRVVLLPKGVMLTSISHLRLARSTDGRHFRVDEKPTLSPDFPFEAYGLEDPRITKVDDTYYIVYKGVSPTGIVQALATTKDFVTFHRQGIIFCPENMDAMLFPAIIRGKYVALHRPVSGMMGGPMMYLAYGTDPTHWGEHHFLLGRSRDGWDSGRVGGGAVPFLTDKGWLEIYHAATPGDHYCLGALLLDADHPERILAKSAEPIMKPEASYETNGFVNNVVFTCGAIVQGDKVSIYYGAADQVMAGADMSLSEIMKSLKPA